MLMSQNAPWAPHRYLLRTRSTGNADQSAKSCESHAVEICPLHGDVDRRAGQMKVLQEVESFRPGDNEKRIWYNWMEVTLLIRLLQLVRPSATRQERDESFAASTVRTCHFANPASREAGRNHFFGRCDIAELAGLVLR